jgi:hypothetical protein
MIDWTDWLDNLKDSAGALAKDELKNLVNNSLNDADAFIKEQGQKLQKYLQQLANGQISKDEFNDNVQDLSDLLDEQIQEDIIAAKASAQRLVAGIKKLVIGSLSKLIP